MSRIKYVVFILVFLLVACKSQEQLDQETFATQEARQLEFENDIKSYLITLGNGSQITVLANLCETDEYWNKRSGGSGVGVANVEIDSDNTMRVTCIKYDAVGRYENKTVVFDGIAQNFSLTN